MILTVSPVPLTATASGRHVLASTMYSKSTLRSIAGLWAEKPFIDYFPSYEIVTNPRMHSSAFSDNLRSVRDETVNTVMDHFFDEHPILDSSVESPLEIIDRGQGNLESVQCEEELLEAFGK